MKTLSVCVAASTLLTSAGAFAEYRGSPVTDGGAITAVVRVVGEIPQLPPQPVFKEHGVCGDQIPDVRLLAGAGGVLQNAIVFLPDITAGRPAVIDQPLKIDNHGCAFVPHVSVATLGQTLELHNSDPILHDAQAWLGTRTLFNVALPKGRTVDKRLSDVGLIYINCNVRHTWMHAYVLVTEHPYRGVTDSKGEVRLEEVPAGRWTVRVWHELLGSRDVNVEVQPGAASALVIELPAVAADGAAN